MNIIEIIKEELIKRSDLFEEQTKDSKDEYNIYNEHIKYVHKYVKELSKNTDVDKEVLELSALLHDISMTDINLDRSIHNELGSKIAEELLTKYNYPQEKISLIKKIILNHSSKRKDYRTTLEEQILVDADALAHFDSIKNLYSLAHKVMNLDEMESIKFVKDKITKDYNEVSSDAKKLIKDKYEKIISCNTYEELSML